MLLSGQVPAEYSGYGEQYTEEEGSPSHSPTSAAALGTSAGSGSTHAASSMRAGGVAAGDSGSDEGEDEGEMDEEMDDEALARRLHEEEQRDLNQRMLEMSGYHQMTQGEGEEVDVDAMSYEVRDVLNVDKRGGVWCVCV